MKKLLLVLTFLFTTAFSSAQEIQGVWYGILKVPGGQLNLVFHIERSDNAYNATMDSPDQGAMKIPVPLS